MGWLNRIKQAKQQLAKVDKIFGYIDEMLETIDDINGLLTLIDMGRNDSRIVRIKGYLSKIEGRLKSIKALR